MRDKDLARHLATITKANGSRRHGALLAAGVDLALDGFPREAVAVFDLATGQPHPQASLFLPLAVGALRVALGLDKTPAGKKAAAEADARVRGELLSDRWSGVKKPAAKKGLPPETLDPEITLEWFRRALFADEVRRLEILRDLVARKDLLRYYRDDAGLLVADDLARAGDAAAGEALAAWRAQAGSFPERALALEALARVIADGAALRAKSGLAPRQVEGFVKKARAVASAADEEPRPAASSYTVTSLYNQVCLEPKTPKNKQAYFQVAGEVKQGYSLLGDKLGLTTPTEAESCEVAVHVAAPPSKLAGAARLLRFPWKVTGDLYVRSIADAGADHRFAVAPGAYHVTVAFQRKKGGKKGAMDRYSIDVWLER